jgi:ribonuclease P protein subunit RPR2
MKQGYSKKPNKLKEIAEKRITELFRQADLRFDRYPAFSDRYVQLARKISMKYKIKLPKEFKRRICKHCLKYLVPGNNCRVRLTEHKVVYTCLNCNNYMRFPYSGKSKKNV